MPVIAPAFIIPVFVITTLVLPICKLLPLISPIVVRDVPVIAPTFVITALVSPICKLLPLISPVDVIDPVILTLPLIGPPVLSYFAGSLPDDDDDHTALPDTSAAIT